MRKFLGTVVALVLGASLLTGCSSSDKTDGETSKDSATPTVTSQTGDNSGETATSTPGTDMSGDGTKVDLGDLDSETLTCYPDDGKSPSMYYYHAEEIANETFFPDQDKKLGVPYYFAGTVLEEFDDISEYLDMNEHGKLIKSFDAANKGYKVMTKYGQVIVINLSPGQVELLKADANKDVYTLKYYKALFNNLTAYKNLPGKGDTGKFYGFYYGFSEKDECPVFTYGVNYLIRVGNFGRDYDTYKTEETRHYKYRNLIEMDYNVSWSDPYDDGGAISFVSYNDNSTVRLSYLDLDGRTLEDIAQMMLEQFDPDGNQKAELEEGAPNVKLLKQEKVRIGKENDILAYHFEVEADYSGVIYVEDYYIFEAKRAAMVIESYDYTANQNPGTETDYQNELEAMRNTITICGF